MTHYTENCEKLAHAFPKTRPSLTVIVWGTFQLLYLVKLSLQSKGMKLFETGEHRRGKLHAQGLKTPVADQSVEILDDEAGYFGQLQEH